MNEQIFELANVWANLRAKDDRLGITYTFSEKALEQFAELIVNHTTECVRDVLREEDSDLSYAAATQVQNKIKQFFGVEEIMEDQPDEIEYCPTCGEEWSGTSCGALRCGWIEGNEE